MSFFSFFSNQESIFSIYIPFCFFFFYLFWIIFSKAASKKNSYVTVNKIHLKVFLAYLFASLIIYEQINELHKEFLISFILGVYIYFSLHYIFIFQLIGLCKKSVSIAILDSIRKINQINKVATQKKINRKMADQNNGIEEICKSRLNQMIYLKLSKIRKSKYIITRFGKVVYKTMKFLLIIYNIKRL